MRALSAYRRDQRGAAAVEFVLVLPLFLALSFGVVHMSLLVYASVNLHDATEWTARCLAVSANDTSGGACPSTASVQTYGLSRYSGPNISPTFSVISGTTCTGSVAQVQGTGTYKASVGFFSLSVPLTAKSCFP